MGRFKKFSNFSSPPINEKQSEDFENLQEVISMLDMSRLESFFEERGLVIDYIEPKDDDGESIVIGLLSKSYGGEIPPKISYYLDEFKEIFEGEIGVKMSWSFSPNYNCKDIIFHLDSPIDPKVISIKQALRFF